MGSVTEDILAHRESAAKPRSERDELLSFIASVARADAIKPELAANVLGHVLCHMGGLESFTPFEIGQPKDIDKLVFQIPLDIAPYIRPQSRLHRLKSGAVGANSCAQHHQTVLQTFHVGFPDAVFGDYIVIPNSHIPNAKWESSNYGRPCVQFRFDAAKLYPSGYARDAAEIRNRFERQFLELYDRFSKDNPRVLQTLQQRSNTRKYSDSSIALILTQWQSRFSTAAINIENPYTAYFSARELLWGRLNKLCNSHTDSEDSFPAEKTKFFNDLDELEDLARELRNGGDIPFVRKRYLYTLNGMAQMLLQMSYIHNNLDLLAALDVMKGAVSGKCMETIDMMEDVYMSLDECKQAHASGDKAWVEAAQNEFIDAFNACREAGGITQFEENQLSAPIGNKIYSVCDLLNDLSIEARSDHRSRLVNLQQPQGRAM